MNHLWRLSLVLGFLVGPRATPSFAAAPADNWEAGVRQADADYWEAAFNHCDLKRMRTLITDDVEFFHDVIGVTRGKANFVSLTEKNVCTVPNVKLRRVAVDGTVTIEPLRDVRQGDKVYGAIIQGRHRFYVSENGAPEVLDDEARFFHVMLLQNGVWKLARAISYSHGQAESARSSQP
jgi:hypothetical protein